MKSSPDIDEPLLTIGQVAERAGVRASAIRYYERVGVLAAAERVSGQRRYTDEAIDRLGVIGAAQQAGFSLEEIGALLRSSDDGRAAEELRSLAERKLPDVEELIVRAQRMKRWLEVASGCECGSLDACSLFSPGNPAPAASLEVIRSGTAAPASLP